MIYRTSRDKEDLPFMAALGAENYGHENDISKIPFLDWQCFANPAGTAETVLAFDETQDRLIGECTQIYARLRAFGQTIHATCLVNTLIRKQNRALPVFYNLHKTSLDACRHNALAYAIPNPHSYPLFCKVFSFVTVGHIPLLVVPMRPKALVRMRICQKLSVLMPDIPIKGKRRKPPRGVRVAAVSADDTRFFDLFSPMVMDKYPIMGDRRAAYVKWRYYDCPCRSYTIFAVWNDEKPAGYAVLRVTDVAGIKNGMLVDFLMAPGCRDEAAVLLSHCLAYFYEHDVQLAGALMLPHCAEYEYLKASGFWLCPHRFLPQPFPLIVKTFGENAQSYETLSNWFITMGDYDAV